MRRRSNPTAAGHADYEGVATEPASRTQRHTQHRLTAAEVEVLIAGYQAGLTLDELASSFAVDPLTVATHLERRGVARRGRKLTEEQVTEAAALYKAGSSLSQLGAKFGVYPQSMRYRLKRAGVQLRPAPGRERR